MLITFNVFLTSRYFLFFAFDKPIFYHLKDEQAVHGDESMKQQILLCSLQLNFPKVCAELFFVRMIR